MVLTFPLLGIFLFSLSSCDNLFFPGTLIALVEVDHLLASIVSSIRLQDPLSLRELVLHKDLLCLGAKLGVEWWIEIL